MIRISCKNERFTYDMYHIVKSFLPDAEISQKVDPEQELLIEMTAEEEPDLEEQACDKKVRWTFFHCREAEIAEKDRRRTCMGEYDRCPPHKDDHGKTGRRFF